MKFFFVIELAKIFEEIQKKKYKKRSFTQLIYRIFIKKNK